MPGPATHLCLTHKGPHAALADPGLHICRHCLTRLADTLTDLPRLWQQLHDLELTSRTGGHRRAGTSSQAPCRLDVLALLDPRSGPDPDLPPAAGIIGDWATLLADTRHYATPTNLADQCDLLLRNLPWLAAQHYIADLHHELRTVHAVLRRFSGETAAVIATCQQPHPDPQHDGECGGPLIHDPTNHDHPVRCVECGDRWSASSLDLAWQQLQLHHHDQAQ